MGFLRKLVGILGLGKDEGGHEAVKDEEDDGDSIRNSSGDGDERHADNQPRFRETGLPRKGFSVPVQVAVDRSHLGPVLQPCAACDGGVQGLRWYSRRLRVDEDGDVAEEFLNEVWPEPSSNPEDQTTKLHARLEVNHKTTRPVKVKGQMVSSDGKIQQCIEHHGKQLWV